MEYRQVHCRRIKKLLTPGGVLLANERNDVLGRPVDARQAARELVPNKLDASRSWRARVDLEDEHVFRSRVQGIHDGFGQRQLVLSPQARLGRNQPLQTDESAELESSVAVYVDASVVLRIVLAEPEPMSSWPTIDRPVSSELLRVECLRTIDRARLTLRVAEHAAAAQRAAALDLIAGIDFVPLSKAVLERASDPFPTSLSTLDAIHLASALVIRDQFDHLGVATHDAQLGLAARAVGFEVDGLPV